MIDRTVPFSMTLNDP